MNINPRLSEKFCMTGESMIAYKNRRLLFGATSCQSIVSTFRELSIVIFYDIEIFFIIRCNYPTFSLTWLRVYFGRSGMDYPKPPIIGR